MCRWRAGPCCLLLAAACALGRPPPRSAARCLPAGACFSAHPANASYDEARGACGSRGGGLAWAGAESELELLLALLAEAAAGPALFWVGLKRNASVCTDAGRPLRGFSWEERGGAAPREVPAALGRWAKEPVRTCTAARCAGLQLADADGQRWGWRELPCQRHGRGYACRYREEGACPDLRPHGALSLDYRLPFGKGSAAPGFSPPGTELAVACPGGEVLLRCRHGPGGFAWEGAEEPDCVCRERCAPAPGAAADPRLSAPAPSGSAAPPATSPAGRGGTAAPPPSSSSSSSNYVFILVTVAVVVLVILVMTVLGVFKLCFNAKAAGGGDKEPAAAGGEAEAGGAEPRGAAGAE